MTWVSMFNSDVLLILAYRLSPDRHFLLKKLPQGLEIYETDPAVAHVRPQNFLPSSISVVSFLFHSKSLLRSLQGSAIEEVARNISVLQERTRKQISNEPALPMFPVTSTVKISFPFFKAKVRVISSLLETICALFVSNSEGLDSHSDSLVMAVLAVILVAFVVVEYAAAGVGDLVRVVASVAVVAEVVPTESGEFLYVWSNVSAKPRLVRVKGEVEGVMEREPYAARLDQGASVEEHTVLVHQSGRAELGHLVEACLFLFAEVVGGGNADFDVIDANALDRGGVVLFFLVDGESQVYQEVLPAGARTVVDV